LLLTSPIQSRLHKGSNLREKSRLAHQNSFYPNFATQSQSPTALPSPTPRPVKFHVAVAGELYTSRAEGLSFEVLGGWTVKEQYPDAPYDSVEIYSPMGLRLEWNSQSGGVGGACDPSQNPHVFIHATTPVPGIPGSYIVEAGPEDSTTQVGIMDRDIYGRKLEKAPKIGDTGVCLYYTMFKSRDGKRDMWLSAPGIAVATRTDSPSQGALTADEIATIKSVLLSASYK